MIAHVNEKLAGSLTGFGASVKRKEDPALLRGDGQFIDDIHLPEMLHAAFVRSPYAHAKINRIDVFLHSVESGGNLAASGGTGQSPPCC